MTDDLGQEAHNEAENVLWHYSAAPGIFDEMAEAPATPRAHWRSLIESLQQLGRHELVSRWDNGRRLIRENNIQSPRVLTSCSTCHR